MISTVEFGNIDTSQDAESLGKIMCQCFNFPFDQWPIYAERLGLDNFRVVRHAGQIIGGLGIYEMGQWFGEKCLPMAGISAVSISPEYRGQGVAKVLLHHTLKELQVKGIPISTLYPATQYLYRQVGYEQGGSRCGYSLPLDSIEFSDRRLPISRVQTITPEAFQPLYQQQAKITNGNLERNLALWQGIIQQFETEIYAYLVGEENQPQGYIIFSQKRERDNSYLQIWDWVALTPSALGRLWTFLADHRSQIQTAQWYAGAIEPRLLILPEQTATIRDCQQWFLRIIDIVKTLNGRGYPQKIEAELHLALADNLLAQNHGNFILKVSGGQGEVIRGGRGDFRLDVRSLAPLYTGLFTPAQLQIMGEIDTTSEALLIATQIFVSAHPWMPDFF